MTRLDDSHTSIDPPSGAAGEPLDDPRVLEIVQEYLVELEGGRAPDRSRFLARYPELSGAVSDCLDGLELVRGGFSASGTRSFPAMGRGSAADRATEAPPQALGDFRIIREIARGGMGIVYEAIQQSLGRRVALKVLPFAATFDSRQLQRFKNEAQAAALLHHTNIVPIYAVGCERGVHFYAMQLIEGQSLAVVIRQLREQAGLPGGRGRGPASDQQLGDAGAPTRSIEAGLPGPVSVVNSTRSTQPPGAAATATQVKSAYFRKAARLMIQAADALEHAHQLGVVHRDIKPGNLMMNSAGELWITDFGLAMFQTETGLTRSGDMLGTFRYMSPEQASGKRAVLDHRTDIYSLGATFYELLTLEPVFAGETRAELLFQILHEEPRPPRSWNRTIPVELETIVLKALSKSPDERYASAGEMAADLRRFLDHEPILAQKPSLWDRMRKWSRRHPGTVATAGVLLTVICVGSLVATALVARAQQSTAAALDRERLRANEAEEQFHRARAAVDVLIEVSEEELVDKPSLETTRKRLLRTALDYYQEFIEHKQGDPTSQQELAAVQERVRGILNDLAVLQREVQAGLLGNPAVVEDLDLTPQQEERLKELLPGWFKERMKVFEEMRHRGEGDRRRRFVEIAAEHDRVLDSLLLPEQRKRLNQLAIQSAGIYAFREPDIVSELKLTSEQRATVRELEFQLMVSGLGRRSLGGNWEDRRRNQEQQSRDATDKVVELLTPEQQERWKTLIGPPCPGLVTRPTFRQGT